MIAMIHPGNETPSTPTYDQEQEAQTNINGDGDVRLQLGAVERQLIVDNLIKHVEEDNHKLLLQMRERLDRVGVVLPTVEVKFQDLSVEAECEVVHGKPIPTLWNSIERLFRIFKGVPCHRTSKAKVPIIRGVSGILKPSRMTILLGPPGCGKSTLLKALAGKLDHSLQVTGEVHYNGCLIEDLMPQKISAYISQYNLHTPEMTTRETIDFSALCQGVGSWTDIVSEVYEREKQAGIAPEPEMDTFMKAISSSGLENSVRTEYILKILGLTNCADTIVGDAMKRGISGGEKKRLGTAEMLVGPQRALFMDEISNGLDSSTAFRIITCIQQLVHIMGYTALVSLLQPAPEVFDLFDDILLFAEGNIIYHGPKDYVLNFFEDCGFKCPQRKAIADFLQEVISERDQGQYWYHTESHYQYVSVDEFSAKFSTSSFGKYLDYEISTYNHSNESQLNCLPNKNNERYFLSKWDLLKACLGQELLQIRRNSTFYSLKVAQLLILAVITMTIFFRSTMKVDLRHTNYYLSSLFYGIVRIMVSGVVELPMTVSRLPVFYKQRDLNFYPAWIYCIPSCLVKVPISLLESIVWTAATYYGIGYSPEFSRFLKQVLMFFALHQASLALFRLIGSFCRKEVSTIFVGNLAMQTMFFFGGFIVPKSSMPSWLRWGFWSSLVSYVEIGVAVNEFRAPRWKKIAWGNLTIADLTLSKHGLDFKEHFYWISLGVVFGFSVLLNAGFILAMTFMNSAGHVRPILSHDNLHTQSTEQNNVTTLAEHLGMAEKSARTALPFYHLTVTFQHIYYSIDDPKKKKGHQVRLLQDVTGACRPGVLTALMGVTGAGKTTLMDVLAGRKVGGYIGGDIRIGGHPKVQHTFARISGYCEQADIHSPQITVEESLMFSACLRLPSETSITVKKEFVKHVLKRIELDVIKDMLVGLPGESGLSNEQRKRLTIAVELVANPSVIFMDEPTTGLDARAAAIVMRAVKNVADTGRTVVCTIHQPSIDIFEAFDELILMKEGGRIIYSGPLGKDSQKVVEYFQRIPGIPEIKENQNPATWIMDVTSAAVESKLGTDFGRVYRKSSLYRRNLQLVRQLNVSSESSQLCFPTRYSCNLSRQYQACIWKQKTSYWRNPEYNISRLAYMLIMSILLALLMMQKGNKISNEQDMFNIIGSTYVMLQAIGLNNSASVIPVLATERTIFYRERFAGMYSSWAYSAAMVSVELPYVILETIVFVLITYPAIGFQITAYKIGWYTYASLCKLLCDTYLGMLLVGVSPSVKVATILAAASYTLFNLFSGFFLPGPAIPKWWEWFYWISPTSWSLRALFTSQYGDVKDEMTAFGESKTISSFLADYFGYHHDSLMVVAVVLPIFPILFAALFAFSMEKLNFQRR